MQLINKTNVMRILKGPRASLINVGGDAAMPSWGQNPPAHGDCWEVDFEVDVGAYDIVFIGGSNPHHGTVTVRVDGEVTGVVDQYAFKNTYPTELPLYWAGV